jgi:L-ascorbate metabolism protein UlaG (beta-lactamase superfamily)
LESSSTVIDQKAKLGEGMNKLTVRAIGGPTAVVDYANLRFVLDPTFDEPGSFPNGPITLVKSAGPAASPDKLGPVDAVLISHDHHKDNLDVSGREYALRVPRVFTTPAGAERLGPPATGFKPFEHTEISGVRVTAVPALHGSPEVGLANGPVVGFVLEADDWPTVYAGGDNASLDVVAVIAERFPEIEVAILNVGAAKVPARGDVFLTLTAELAARAAALLGVRAVVPVHQDGWAHFTQGAEDVVSAFKEAGLAEVLVDLRPGDSATF